MTEQFPFKVIHKLSPQLLNLSNATLIFVNYFVDWRETNSRLIVGSFCVGTFCRPDRADRGWKLSTNRLVTALKRRRFGRTLRRLVCFFVARKWERARQRRVPTSQRRLRASALGSPFALPPPRLASKRDSSFSSGSAAAAPLAPPPTLYLFLFHSLANISSCLNDL